MLIKNSFKIPVKISVLKQHIAYLLLMLFSFSMQHLFSIFYYHPIKQKEKEIYISKHTLIYNYADGILHHRSKWNKSKVKKNRYN